MDDPKRDALQWLTALVMGAAGVVHDFAGDPELQELTRITNNGNEYVAYVDNDGEPLLRAKRFTLYVCKLPDGRQGLIKITPNGLRDRERSEYNQALSDEADRLRLLNQEAKELDDKRIAQGKDPFHYDIFFPELIDAFVPEGDPRQILILGYADTIEAQSQLVPLSRVINPTGSKREYRLDLRTAVWVFGKLLKAIGWAHEHGIIIYEINLSNILIECDQHGVLPFDLSNSSQYPSVPPGAVSLELKKAAQCIWHLAGGDDKNDPPYDPDLKMSPEQYTQYIAFLKRLIENKGRSANDEHRAFYALADSIWPRKFWPFKVYPL